MLSHKPIVIFPQQEEEKEIYNNISKDALKV